VAKDDFGNRAFIGTKTLLARPMTRGEYNAYRGWQPPAGEDQGVCGCLVTYPDGYESWSPAEAFQAYETFDAMSFMHALYFLKAGMKLARAGWNGADQFVYRVPGASYPVQTGAAASHFGQGSMVPYRAYYAIKTAQGDVATWAPSNSDMDADDWYLVQ
jgi:hypothetical protein